MEIPPEFEVREVEGDRRAIFLEERLGAEQADGFLVCFAHWKRRLAPAPFERWVQLEVGNGAFFLAPRDGGETGGLDRLGIEVTLGALETLASHSEEPWGPRVVALIEGLRTYQASLP